MCRVTIVLWLWIWISVDVGAAERIVLSAEPKCGACNLVIPVGTTAEVFVLASSTFGGTKIGGAEFSVHGFPEDWIVNAIPNPDSHLQSGDPLGAGVSMAFPFGQSNDCSTLYTLQVHATSSQEDVKIEILAKDPPSNSQLNCPRLFYECGPCDIWICVEGTSLFINSESDCLVSISQMTWGGVKGLFEPHD